MTNNQIVDDIKQVANIVDVIGDVVTLKKTGSNFQGLCPFHNEKTPSFVVSEQKQIFTCFGCSASGDVIEFVKKYKNLDFIDAVEELANRYGLDFNKYQSGNKKDNDKLYEINKETAIFFYKNLLKNQHALNYLVNRKIKAETIYEFGIGYAENQWQNLYNFLKSKGYEEKDMIHLGLISHSKGKYFDKFRNRIIFPIKDIKGRVIGFGGRSLGDDMPKYLNSPENSIFHKKNNLYGLNLSKSYISEKNTAILVEGYMDVISLYQAGVKNVSASLGTALTENQGKMLKRYTNNVVLSYDSDNAGQNAVIRGGNILKNQGLRVSVLKVTDGKDPDDFIKSKGKNEYIKLVENSILYNDYMIDNIAQKYDLNNTEDKISFSKEIISFLNSLKPLERDIYIEVVSKKFGFRKETLLGETNIISDTENNKNNNKFLNYSEKELIDTLSKDEKRAFKIMLKDNFFIEKFIEKKSSMISHQGKSLFKHIENIYLQKNKVELSDLIEVLSEEEMATIDNIIENFIVISYTEREFDGILYNLAKKNLEEKLENLIEQINIAKEENRQDIVLNLMKEYNEIQKKIKRGGVVYDQ